MEFVVLRDEFLSSSRSETYIYEPASGFIPSSYQKKLLTDLKLLVSQERNLTIQILRLLQKVEKDLTYAVFGYASLFDFAVKELGYSQDSAYRRISAMRLMYEVPEVVPKLESGTLGLTAASEFQKFLRAEKLSSEDKTGISHEKKLKILDQIENKPTREVAKILFQESSDGAKVFITKAREKQISENLTQITVTVDEALRRKLHLLLDYYSHKNEEGSYRGLLEILVKECFERNKINEFYADENEVVDGVVALQKLELKKEEHTSGFRKPSEKNSRYISLAVKRAVLLRDKGRCQYPGCGATRYLHFDHKVPFSLGAPSTADNIQLLCSAHNRLKGSVPESGFS